MEAWKRGALEALRWMESMLDDPGVDLENCLSQVRTAIRDAWVTPVEDFRERLRAR